MINVLLPLAVDGTFTYALSEELEGQVGVGQRVVVQFGARRFYTGIVTNVHAEPPVDGVKVKTVSETVDGAPIVLPEQLKLWDWMAQYYMCTLGEVMKAALPTGLKLESETLILRAADAAENVHVLEEELTYTEKRVLAALDDEKGKTIAEIERQTNAKQVLRCVRRLIDLGLASVRETLASTYRPRTETLVRLSPQCQTEEALHKTLDSLKRAPMQEALLVRYLTLSEATAAVALQNARLLKPVSRQLLCPESAQAAALAALRKKGVLETYERTVPRLGTTIETSHDDGTTLAKPLSPQQQRAYDEIGQAFSAKNVCLLHGVTSSGKTEIYIQLIREHLRRGEQVLYLVPEIALTTQLTQRLAKVFGNKMGVYHSKFPDAERVELWKRQLTGNACPLIVGVRSSLFLPFRKLGLIIVDEEHEASYKQQDPAPRYNARDTAILLARQLGAKVLLGSATPSVETYHNAQTGKYALVELFERFGGVQLPQVVIEDVKELQRKKIMKTPFSPRLVVEVDKALKEGCQAILFQNRRGYAPVLECKVCGWTPRCTRCDVSLTYHKQIHKLICHYCGAQHNVPEACPCCGETDLRDQGCGTEKIEQEAETVFPEARAVRMDLDTTRSRTAYEGIINDFAHGKTNLLIGTQMVTKGLDFGKVRVVGILNADQMLNLPDYRAWERAYQMLSQVAGRAGRRGERGLVVLQTKQPDHSIIRQVVAGDYRSMYRAQIAERQAFCFPPFCRLINVYLKHRKDEVVEHAAQHFAALLRPHFREGILGPDRPLVSRVQLLYIRKVMVKVPLDFPVQGVRRTLLEARAAVQQYAVYKSVTIYFDVE